MLNLMPSVRRWVVSSFCTVSFFIMNQVLAVLSWAYPWVLFPDAVVQGICKCQPCQVGNENFASKGIHLVELSGCNRCQCQCGCISSHSICQHKKNADGVEIEPSTQSTVHKVRVTWSQTSETGWHQHRQPQNSRCASLPNNQRHTSAATYSG